MTSRGHSVSDIGRLFRRSVSFGQEPIENFTSEALAIAIEHDDGPIRLALRSIAWAKSPPFEAGAVTHVGAHPQHHLAARDGLRMGYLDLVLDVAFADEPDRPAWIEVKIETGEHHDQLDVYAEHARPLKPRPVIFTLSKAPLRPADRNPRDFDIGWLSWNALAIAIEQSPGADERWVDFLSFLEEERVAWRGLPSNLHDPARHLAVLFDVNLLVRDRWPKLGMDYPGKASVLLGKIANAEYERSGRLTATGGPLIYGLVPAGNEWCWWLAVGSANVQRVPLEPGAIVNQANQAGLSDRWHRSGTRHAAVELHGPLLSESTHESAVEWFRGALDEIANLGILRAYADGFTVKTGFR